MAGLGGLFSVRSRIPVDGKDDLREDLVDELKDKLRLEREKVCQMEDTFEQLDARIAKQEENFERVVKEKRALEVEKRALERELDEFKIATDGCGINYDEFGKMSAEEKKGLLISSAKELQFTKLKVEDLEKQLGKSQELLEKMKGKLESDKNDLVEIIEEMQAEIDAMNKKEMEAKKEMQEKSEEHLATGKLALLKELASVQKQVDEQLDVSNQQMAANKLEFVKELASVQKKSAEQLDASKEASKREMEASKLEFAKELASVQKKSEEQLEASKQETEAYVTNNTKSSANEIRIMLNSLTKDAALEKEAAVEQAKKSLNQEWELKMREMLHDYAADQSSTMNEAIKEKDEQIKLMKETMIETMEKEKGQGALEISKIVLHLERTQKTTLQEALAAEREKLTGEHNADLGKVLDEYAALERSKNEMEQRHENSRCLALTQFGEDKDSTSSEIAELKKQLKNEDQEHGKELGKVLDRLGRMVQDKAVTEEERDSLKATNYYLTQNLQDAKETITNADAALLKVIAERDTAQEELQKFKADLQSLAETLSAQMEELDSCKDTMAQLVTATQESDRQSKITEADRKEMESEMAALFHDNKRMEALLLEAEKTKAETEEALATLAELEDREAVLTTEKAHLQMSLNAYKLNLAEITTQANESDQLYGVLQEEIRAEHEKFKALEEEYAMQVKALEEEKVTQVTALEGEVKALAGEVKAVEEEKVKLGETNEELKAKLAEQCTITAEAETEMTTGVEEAMTLMYKWQDSYHEEKANAAKTQEQLEETQGDLTRMSDHALDMEEQQAQAKAFFKQIKEEKARLEEKVVDFDQLTQEKERAVVMSKKFESSLALSLADLELLRMETKERAKLDLEREVRDKMEQDAVQKANSDLDSIINQYSSRPGAKKALDTGNCLALPGASASPFGADEQDSMPRYKDDKKAATTSTSKKAAELPDFLKDF